MRSAQPVSRILADIVRSNHAGSVESRGENRGLTRHLEVGKGRSGHARQRVEAVDLALVVYLIVEEGAEFSAGPFGCGIRYNADQFREIEFSRHGASDTAEHPQAFDLGGTGIQACASSIAQPCSPNKPHRRARAQAMTYAIDQ